VWQDSPYGVTGSLTWPGGRSESTNSTDPNDGEAECADFLDALEGARVLFIMCCEKTDDGRSLDR